MNAGLQTAYGLEYSGGVVTVVHALRRKGRLESTVLAGGIDPLTDKSWPELADRIRRDQESGRAMVAAPAFSHESFIRPLEAPFSSLKKARAILPSLLDVQLPFPLEQCTYRFVHVHKPEGGNVRAVAVAIPGDRLQQLLDGTRSIGIDPECMEQESIVLWRFALQQAPSVSMKTRVVLYLGADRTVVVSGKNKLPAASFGTRAGWSPAMDLPAREKLVTRIRQHLAGALRGDSGSPEFLVCGPGAASAEPLREQLEVLPDQWRILANPESCLARTLAEGLLKPDAWCENLRTGTLAHAHLIRHARRGENRSLVIMAAASLLLMLASAGSLLAVRKTHDDLQAGIQREAAALTGMNYIPRGQELFIAKQYIDNSGDRFREFRLWLEPDAYPRFREIVQSALLIDMSMETLSVRAGAVLARGSCADWNDPDKITQPLAALGWKVEVERKDAGHDERVHFTVRAQP